MTSCEAQPGVKGRADYKNEKASLPLSCFQIKKWPKNHSTPPFGAEAYIWTPPLLLASLVCGNQGWGEFKISNGRIDKDIAVGLVLPKGCLQRAQHRLSVVTGRVGSRSGVYGTSHPHVQCQEAAGPQWSGPAMRALHWLSPDWSAEFYPKLLSAGLGITGALSGNAGSGGTPERSQRGRRSTAPKIRCPG